MRRNESPEDRNRENREDGSYAYADDPRPGSPEPNTNFGEGGVGTEDPGFVGTDRGAVEQDLLFGVGTPDEQYGPIGGDEFQSRDATGRIVDRDEAAREAQRDAMHGGDTLAELFDLDRPPNASLVDLDPDAENDRM